jgi:L-fucose mutarotase
MQKGKRGQGAGLKLPCKVRALARGACLVDSCAFVSRSAMLRFVDPVISAELLYVLMLMGHGDDIVVCDVNHPAATIARETTYGHLVDLPGCDIPRATSAILSMMPLDTFVEQPVMRMQVVGNPAAVVPIFAKMQQTVDASEGRNVKMGALERFDFYAAAKRSFGIVRTSDPGPYGCFILRKGVIDLTQLK